MLPMKQTQKIISTYTSDVSGVCSALYELGGMTVMHDASGCNSTYNTHDEPRWYDSESLVFVSGLTEIQAVTGDDEKLISDVTDAARELKPRFIAIAGSPIPMMTGCDIPAIAREIEARTGIPSFGFNTDGMHSYVVGAGEALAAYLGRFVSNREKVCRGVNILGVTPVDFSVNGSVGSMKRFFSEGGFEVISAVAMGSSPDEIARAASAEVNFVVSSVGLDAAELLFKRFGTPYVVGLPVGEFGKILLSEAEKTLKTGESRIAFDFLNGADSLNSRSVGSENHADFCGSGVNIVSDNSENYNDFLSVNGKNDLFIIGESVTSRSLAAAIALKYRRFARVICPLERSKGLLSASDFALSDEEATENLLKTTARAIIADPLYKPIIPENSRFYPLPHEGFSGRLFRKKIPDLIAREV